MLNERFGLKRIVLGLALLAALLSMLVSAVEGQNCDPCASNSTKPTFVLLHTWAGDPTDGSRPYAGLVVDKQGNLYGTTSDGGGNTGGRFGTVFKITPTGELTLLYSFNGVDGSGPYGNLLLDAQGNLYGTTSAGGASDLGTVFKLSPTGTLKVLYSFSGPDGFYPLAGLVRDRQGNLYGTTYFGGNFNFGTVFKITPTGTETVLHSFGGPDGDAPYGGLVLDENGNLYGTTVVGGAFGYGTVFEVTPTGTETVLHSFTDADGYSPQARLIRDAQGNLYSTTRYGGATENGTVFKLSPTGTLTLLHSFTQNSGDGRFPYGDLIPGGQGNFYGTTTQGGVSDGGTVFRLTPNGTVTVLHSFAGGAADGLSPYAGLVRDAKGDLYGTTFGGGAFRLGTVFALVP